MPIGILRKEDVINKDPIDMEVGLDKSILEEDERIEKEDELLNRAGNNGGNKKDIREKIIEFIKSQGYVHAPGGKEVDYETTDLFGKDGVLVEVAITDGIDAEVLRQMIEGIWNSKIV